MNQPRIAPPGADRAMRKPHRLSYLALCFVAAALLFDKVITTLVVGLLAYVLYEIVFRRNPRVIVLVVSSVACFVAFEHFGKIILKAQFARVFDEGADHRLKPDKSRGINSDGIRCPYEADHYTDRTYNIVFLGDSFTYGAKLPYEESFPAQVEAILRDRDPALDARCINFGWISSSPGPSLRLLKDIGEKYKPKLVIMCLDMTDFGDDVRSLSNVGYWEKSPTAYLLMQFGLRGALQELHESTWLNILWRAKRGLTRPLPVMRFFVTNQPLEESILDMQETERNLQRIVDFSRDTLGAKFILVMLPRHFQYSYREAPKSWEKASYTVMGPYVKEPFKWLAALRARVDYPCYSLLEDFEKTSVFPTCFEDDPHWNAAGCRVAAEGIVRILSAEGITRAAAATQPASRAESN
ncbi:MAG: hypothetical protein DCC65_07160 [Planctomycetota bacterium]|nr:MAG: hypothetical protein DCC65_07160 [Planctomycetota bacterium]